jgi:chemotaxis-related protein WspB
MLFLIFRLGPDRYALDANEIVEVLPRVALKALPSTPAWVAGVFDYRGQMVPVIDLPALALGRPATDHMSTRTILITYPADEGSGTARPHVLGVIAEHANRTLRRDAADFHPSGIDTPDAPYLGPIATDADGLLQWIHVPGLLPPDVRASLFAAELTP